MTTDQFYALCAAGPLLLDGATGTQLQLAGMPSGVCPETWVLDHPTVLEDLQHAYLSAGSSIIYAFTFGANRLKLAAHHLNPDETGDINRRLAAISTSVRDQWHKDHPELSVWVAGDLAPTGLFLSPAGDLAFEDLVSLYREQVRAQLAAGVDLFVAETMMDLAQTRAAVLAVQAECDLPIMTSLTFEANGRTLSGNTPQECLITLAALGAAAFGMNCSFGPDKLIELLQPLLAISPLPLLAKPNAGMPYMINGQTRFPMQAAAFAAAMRPMAAAGVRLLGGCCGTDPEYIARLADELQLQPAFTRQKPSDCGQWICSSRQSVSLDSTAGLPVILCQTPGQLADDVLDQLDDDPPAAVLDLSAARPAEESSVWIEALLQLQLMTAVPLIFKDIPSFLSGDLLRIYQGRAGITGSYTGKTYGALYLPQ
ncbi:MAG: homocysteine S-methyltransferase family protein [Clostridiaceae bacterium]|nr:homocysteine S-methyltransferase family protein [Clostridiaceae bacterium]